MEICECGDPINDHKFYDFQDGGSSHCNNCVKCTGYKPAKIPQESAFQVNDVQISKNQSTSNVTAE